MTWTPGFRQFQADFMVPGYGLRGTSLTRRPDAVSMDYLWSAAPGPVANGDPSAGLAARAWYARADDAGNVYLARANAGNTDWESETLLFSYTGPPILEMGLAFEQQGRPVIAAERATGAGGDPEVWLYWYDPTELPDPAFVFQSFGPGRTPRTLFDDLERPQSGDVQFVYLKDGVGLVRREQRDRYQVEYGSSLTDTTNRYIEEVLTTRGARLRVEGSLRDPVLGTYARWLLESLPYPLYLGPDEATSAVLFLSGDMVAVMIEVTAMEGDSAEGSLSFLSAVLDQPIIQHFLYDTDEAESFLGFLSADLVVAVIAHILYDKDEAESYLTMQAAELLRTHIAHTSGGDQDSAESSAEFLSATLEVA